MFIKFFKSSFFIQYLVIGMIGLSLWISAFIKPPGMPSPEEPVPLYSLCYALLSPYPLLATILGFCLILAEAYWLTQILSKHELILKNSSLSALVFIVMMSFLPAQLTLNPINITLAFMILILRQLLITYNKPEHIDRIYAAGFFTGIASMFYLTFILWFIFVIISFLIIRAGNWRAWMAAIIGLATPFLYLAVLYFWQGDFLEKVSVFPAYFAHPMIFPGYFQSDFYILGAFTAALSLWGILRFRSGPEKTVEIRVKANILLWTFVFTLLSLVFSKSLAIYHAALAVPALAMVVTETLISLKKARIAEMILLVYYFSVLINNAFLHQLDYF